MNEPLRRALLELQVSETFELYGNVIELTYDAHALHRVMQAAKGVRSIVVSFPTAGVSATLLRSPVRHLLESLARDRALSTVETCFRWAVSGIYEPHYRALRVRGATRSSRVDVFLYAQEWHGELDPRTMLAIR